MIFIKNFSDKIVRLKYEIEDADCIVIGAGSGLSTSAGLTYSGERFKKYFADFIEKYNLGDMYTAGFYPYESMEEYFAYWSRHIYYNRYDVDVGKPYLDLLKLVQDKNYFVITTNVDHQFQLAGFDKERLFYTQGDYGLFQCSKACHNKTYDNEAVIRKMIDEQSDMKIPTELIPRCPVCNEIMSINLRCDNTFVQDDGWHNAKNRYENFLNDNLNKHILFLELGVGMNTPVIIKYPFWQMTYKNPNAFYACINKGECGCPTEIDKRSVGINMDIGEFWERLVW